MTEKEFLDKVTKLMYAKQAKINKIADLEYPAPVSGWGAYYDENMTDEDVENAVNARYREAIVKQEPKNEKKIELFKIVGYNKPEALDTKAVLKQYGKEHLRELTEEDRLDLASKKGWNLEDTNKRISEATDKVIADNAEKIRNERFNDASLARQYLIAKFDGDEEKMKKIEEALGDRADQVLDKSEIPWYAKGARIAGDWLGGQSIMDNYRERIATGEGEDSADPRAVVADVGMGILTGLNPLGKVGGKIAPKIASKIANTRAQNYAGLIGRVGTNAGLGAVEGAGLELGREAVAGEDISTGNILANSTSEATLPTIVEGGAHLVSKTPVVGRLAQQFARGMRKGGDEDLFFLAMDEKMRNNGKLFDQAPKGEIINTTGDELPDWAKKVENRKAVRLDHLEATNDEAKGILNEYRAKKEIAMDKVRAQADADAKAGKPWDEEKLANELDLAERDFINKNGTETQYLYKTAGEDADLMREVYGQTPDEVTIKRLNGEKVTNPYSVALSDLDNPVWNRDVPKTGAQKAHKAVEGVAKRMPVILSNENARKVNDNQANNGAEYRSKESKADTEKRWSKGYASFEEMQTPQYKTWKEAQLRKMMLGEEGLLTEEE